MKDEDIEAEGRKVERLRQIAIARSDRVKSEERGAAMTCGDNREQGDKEGVASLQHVKELASIKPLSLSLR